MKTGRYSVKELFTHNEIEQIIIPEIQRDYVWKAKNVAKLLDSIVKHFCNKEQDQITIEIKGEQIESGSVKEYLQKEYNRLLFNTKIGFVYAYHDNEYAGKFFLIDGQQRFTTLYLLLLAIYVKSNKKDDFKTLYFNNEVLKIDYKVREHSHDFMTAFVKNELTENALDIKLSNEYYKNDYEEDETIINLISNYKTIKELLQLNENVIKTKNSYDDFIEYIEDYVEVNYFDTNISEQGEQLYLYMNSRGEFLSHQELVKSEIIKKEQDLKLKKKIGQNWENWQNFFWNNRGYGKDGGNENADIGFEEFLKWCSIIHICTTDSEEYLEFEMVKQRRQTLREAKENYINRTKSKEEVQKEYLSKYQISQLDANYLNENFEAVKQLFHINSKYLLVSQNWLFDINGAINYVIILPLIFFIKNNKWPDEETKNKDVKRLAMFLYNTTSFLSVSKNPDNATIDGIDLVKSMCDDKKIDVLCFLDSKYEGRFKSFLNSYTKSKFLLFKQADSDRINLELIVWDVLLNKKFNKFLNGDISVIFKVIKKYYTLNNLAFKVDKDYCDTLKKFSEILISVLDKYNVYGNGKDSDLFKRALLTFGDYSIKTKGSYRFGNRIEGYSLGYSDNADNKEINEIFQSDKGFIEDLLISLKKNKTIELSSIIDNYKKSNSKDWREAFIENKKILKYCNKKRILREVNQRIVLISEKDKGYKELQCKVLETLYLNSKMWVFQHNICVLDFDITNNKMEHKENCYALDLRYEQGDWIFSLLYRNEEESDEKLKPFIDNDFGKLNEGLRLVPINNIIYSDDISLSIIENVDNVKDSLDLKLKEIENILIKK
jgi:uncharacterized protein with ParB-like and HNH nuclease domain